MARKKTKNSKNYFTQETEQYIVEFNQSNDQQYRNQIFTNHIYYPFYKLAENLIHTFKFYYLDVESIENLKYEIVSMLYKEKISKFDPTNGAKAYSYFGTIVKRWLINYNNKNYKKLKKVGSLQDTTEPTTVDNGSRETEIDFNLSNFIDVWAEYVELHLQDFFTKQHEQEIADAVITIFKKRNDIEILKKKALYIYIREMTNCKTTHLTKVLNKLKNHFYDTYHTYYDKGILDRI